MVWKDAVAVTSMDILPEPDVRCRGYGFSYAGNPELGFFVNDSLSLYIEFGSRNASAHLVHCSQGGEVAWLGVAECVVRQLLTDVLKPASASDGQGAAETL